MATEIVKERLIKELEKLSQERLQEVLDFVEYLRAKEGMRPMRKSPDALDPSQDPILRLIGIADVEPFSQNIDEALYGT